MQDAVVFTSALEELVWPGELMYWYAQWDMGQFGEAVQNHFSQSRVMLAKQSIYVQPAIATIIIHPITPEAYH
jgi:hypothetical protein